MPDMVDGDRLRAIVDLIKDSIVADAKPVGDVGILQFEALRWAWVSGEFQDALHDEADIGLRYVREVLFDIPIEEDVRGCHVS